MNEEAPAGEWIEPKRFTEEEVAEIFGVTVAEMRDDNGYRAASEQARREYEVFLEEMRRRAERMVATLAVDLESGATLRYEL